METNEKYVIMTQTSNQLVTMIQNRLDNRIELLTSLSGTPMDNVPDSVKERREEEAGKIRAVIQEQKDIIAIIKMLYPGS